MIPEEFIWQMAWLRALGLALLELMVPVILCYAGLIVAFFRKKETSVGIVCLACLVLFPTLPIGMAIALFIGWLRASRWQMRAFMTVWTGLVVLVVLHVIATFLFRNLDGTTLRRIFGVS